MAAPKYLRWLNGKVKELAASVTSAANAIVATDNTGKIDISMMPVGVAAETTIAVSSEALAAGDFVNLFLSAGVLKARKADATTAGKPAHGFVLAAVLLGGTATVYRESNTNTQVSGLTIGTEYFLSKTTPGGLVDGATVGTYTAGNLSQYIGVADSATSIVYDNGEQIEIG